MIIEFFFIISFCSILIAKVSSFSTFPISTSISFSKSKHQSGAFFNFKD